MDHKTTGERVMERRYRPDSLLVFVSLVSAASGAFHPAFETSVTTGMGTSTPTKHYVEGKNLNALDFEQGSNKNATMKLPVLSSLPTASASDAMTIEYWLFHRGCNTNRSENGVCHVASFAGFVQTAAVSSFAPTFGGSPFGFSQIESRLEDETLYVLTCHSVGIC